MLRSAMTSRNTGRPAEVCMAIRPAALHFLPAVRMRYTARIMFIHRAFIAGCGDRGAWPWRKPAQLNS